MEQRDNGFTKSYIIWDAQGESNTSSVKDTTARENEMQNAMNEMLQEGFDIYDNDDVDVCVEHTENDEYCRFSKLVQDFPLIPRLKRLFMSVKTSPLMWWHDENRVKDGKLIHPADSLAWNHFDKTWPEFSLDARNVILKTEEVFVFASQVQQVFYVQDPIDNDWHAVVHTKPRDLYDMPSDPLETMASVAIPSEEFEINEENISWTRSGIQGRVEGTKIELPITSENDIGEKE